MSGVKVNVSSLEAFQAPLRENHGLFLDVLRATKNCSSAIGEGSGMEDAIILQGKTLEKAFNGSSVPAAQAMLDTVVQSAENADELKKFMLTVEPVSTAAITNSTVEKGVRPVGFTR